MLELSRLCYRLLAGTMLLGWGPQWCREGTGKAGTDQTRETSVSFGRRVGLS